MTRSAGIALVAALFVANCGGAPEQPQQSTPSEQAPLTESAESPDLPAAPPNTVGPVATPPPGAAAGAAAGKRAASKAPPAKPAYTRTDLEAGTGQEAVKGRTLSVHYTGWLYDPTRPEMKGRMFDSSRDRGPFSFQLGAGQVIPGWDQGFDGMRVGGRRRLVIPPSLGYGVDGAGGGIIPPNATLLFEMELLDVR